MSSETTHGDPLVPEHGDGPHREDHPHSVPEDPEPPQGDPLMDPPEEPETDGGEETDPLAAAEARAQEYLDLAQRKQADFENFRRRMNLQVAQAEDRGIGKLAKELLPALDHLELALEAAEKHAGEGEWVKGIRLVQEELLGALGRVGIQAFAPFGEPFDPNEHEAISQQPSEEHESGVVLEVYQQGYRLNGAVLRPARVVVSQ